MDIVDIIPQHLRARGFPSLPSFPPLPSFLSSPSHTACIPRAPALPRYKSGVPPSSLSFPSQPLSFSASPAVKIILHFSAPLRLGGKTHPGQGILSASAPQRIRVRGFPSIPSIPSLPSLPASPSSPPFPPFLSSHNCPAFPAPQRLRGKNHPGQGIFLTQPSCLSFLSPLSSLSFFSKLHRIPSASAPRRQKPRTSPPPTIHQNKVPCIAQFYPAPIYLHRPLPATAW